MSNVRSQAAFPVTAILYVLVALAAAKLTASTFAIVLIITIALRLLFGLVDTIGSAVAWRLDGQKKATESALAVLRTNEYPKRHFAHDDFASYLIRIERGADYSAQLKSSAREWAKLLAFFETLGVLVGMRMHAVAESALEMYSPRAEASTIESLSNPSSQRAAPPPPN